MLWDEVARLEAERSPLVEKAFVVPRNEEVIQSTRSAIQKVLQLNELISEQLSTYRTSVTSQLQSIDTGRQATRAYQEILRCR